MPDNDTARSLIASSCFLSCGQKRDRNADGFAKTRKTHAGGNRITTYNRLYGNNTAPIIDDGQRLVQGYRIERYQKVILAVYSRYNAALEVRRENRHVELMAKLDSIQKTLNENNEKLIQTLREEFAKTRQVLVQGFSHLGSKLDVLAQKMDVLHNDLVQIHHDLGEIKIELKDIGKSIQETNHRLAKIDGHLQEVNQNLVAIGNEMRNGFAGIGQSVWAASEATMMANAQMFDNMQQQITANGRRPVSAKSTLGWIFEEVVGSLAKPLEFVPFIGTAAAGALRESAAWTGDNLSNQIFPNSQVPVPSNREFVQQVYAKAHSQVVADGVSPNLIVVAESLFENDKKRALQAARGLAKENNLPPSLANLILDSATAEELQTNLVSIGTELLLNPGTLQYVMDYLM